MSKTIFPIMVDYRFRDRLESYRERGLLGVMIGLPWAMLAPHEKQAQTNHSQSLERLAQRGGLSAGEAVAILDGKCWSEISGDEVTNQTRLKALFVEWQSRTALSAAEGSGK